MILVAVLTAWMLICGWCGFRRRFFGFLATLLVGLAMNMAWMIIGLNSHPFDAHALMAQMSVLMYGIGAFGVGWMAGRLVLQFRKTRVD
jgi:hypothetical protein